MNITDIKLMLVMLSYIIVNVIHTQKQKSHRRWAGLTFWWIMSVILSTLYVGIDMNKKNLHYERFACKFRFIFCISQTKGTKIVCAAAAF
jgi:hypothetical protein